MNDPDSLSMTPPISPDGFLLEDLAPSPPKMPSIEDKTNVACFHCLGEQSGKGTNFHSDSYWKTGWLNSLFSPGSRQEKLSGTESVSLFSYTWPVSVVHNSNIEKLFLFARQRIGELQSAADRSRLTFVTDGSMNWQEERENICQFLQYLLDAVHSTRLSEESVSTLVTSLHSLLLHLGRLCELPHHVLQSTLVLNKNSIPHQCFHMHLDVYWHVVCILHQLQITYSGSLPHKRLCVSYDNDLSLCEQMIQLIIWDLVALAHLRYRNKAADGDPQKYSLFACSCVQELWTLTLRLTEWRSSNHIGESFWINLHHVMKSILEEDTLELLMEMEDCRVMINPPEGFRVEDPAGLCMCIMYNVAPLFIQKLPGAVETDRVAVSNYHDLQILLKKILTSPGLTETVLRCHLRTCLLLTSGWEPNTGILLTLWDFFYKRMNKNDSFQSVSGTLDGYACIDQSVDTMYDRCKQWTQGHEGNLDKETSYQLFLRLLGLHLGKLYNCGSTQEWKQVKGRIYSKFHARRIQELTEGGLYNLTVLFVTLGMTADLEDVASKLCDFYDMLDIGSITFAKRSVVWRGAFTLMLVYVERDMDITFLADRMVAAVESAISDFATAGIDTRHNLWKLILICLEGLQEVVEASKTLQLSEHKLIGSGFMSLLSMCSEHELRSTLSTLHSVIQTFRQVITDKRPMKMSVPATLQHAEFGSALWRNVYSFIANHAQTLTPPPVLADIAGSFCLLSMDSPPDDRDVTFVSVFQMFSASEKVSVSVSSRFLSQLLSSTEVLTQLEKDLDNHERFIIGAWFRCCLHLPLGAQILAEITRPVLCLREVREILQQAGLESIGDIDQAPVIFLKALEKAHRNIQSWQEKMKFQQKIIPYFSDVLKHITPVMKSLSPAEVVHNMYRMIGCLVKYCSKLLFVRQDVIIPGLISAMVVPHNVLDPDKPINPVFLSAVRDHLHMFVQGLGKLPYDRDPFVQRRLRDIITVYLPKFNLRPGLMSLTASSVTSVHPLVASLSGSFVQSPSEDATKFRHYMLQMVVSSYLPVKNMSIHPSHALGISYIQELLQRTTSTEVKAKDLSLLLHPCLEYLLLLPDTSATWNTVLSVLQALSESYMIHLTSMNLSELSDSCGQFVSSYFKFSSTGVLRVMEKLAVLLPDIVTGSVDKLTDCVMEIEKKRGVGKDQSLRSQYVQVLKLLGSRGSEEIHKLQSGIS